MTIQKTEDKPCIRKQNGVWQVSSGLASSHKWDHALAILAVARLNQIDKRRQSNG